MNPSVAASKYKKKNKNKNKKNAELLIDPTWYVYDSAWTACCQIIYSFTSGYEKSKQINYF